MSTSKPESAKLDEKTEIPSAEDDHLKTSLNNKRLTDELSQKSESKAPQDIYPLW